MAWWKCLLLVQAHSMETVFEKTTGQESGIIAFFKNADVNGDGQITAEEIHEKMQKDYKPSQAKKIKDEILTNWDSDDENSILKHRVEFPRNSGNNITTDADGDGFITFEEFRNTDYHWLKMQEDKADPSDWLANAGHAFKLSDANNDGKLDAHEFVCFRHPYLCDIWDTFAAPIVDKQMVSFDKDGNEFITFDELWAGYIANAEEGMTKKEIEDGYLKQMKDEFKQLDSNEDKKLTKSEFQEWVHPDPVRVMHPSVKRQKLDLATSMVKHFDKDGDDKVALTELLADQKWLQEQGQAHFKEEL